MWQCDNLIEFPGTSVDEVCLNTAYKKQNKTICYCRLEPKPGKFKQKKRSSL